MSSQFKRIQSAVVDGRAQTPRYIQKQLTRLHEALVKSNSAIKNAIKSDSGYSDSEAEVEYYLTVEAVRQEFASIDFEDALSDEYKLAHSKNRGTRRVACGCVYVIPSKQSPLYSTIVPVAMAISAGNCVILEIKQTLSELTTVLKQVLSGAMDKDTFCTADSKPDESFLSQNCIVLDGTPVEKPVTSTRSIATPLQRNVAIVDRSAKVSEAAREIARARFAFGGRSAYAPDLVLVNEFILKEFCSAVTQHALSLFAEQIDVQQKISNPRKNKTDSRGQRQDDSTVTLVSGSKGSVILARKRDNSLLQSKITESMLVIHSMSSLDDAIDLSNSSGNHLLATYLFADPAAAKYLSQFINCNLSCTNGIPADLLVGPAAPTGFTPAIQPRYNKDMFSTPRPELISFPEQSQVIAKIIDKDDFKSRQAISKKALQALPSMKEPTGKAIGFFEQGLITGGSVFLTSLVATAVVSRYFIVPAIMKRLR